MIEATQRKLREAKFFYSCLVRERERPSINEPEAFRYYFSAFINAARSIPWVLSNEQREKYVVWRDRWEATLSDEDRKFLKFTNELRVDEVKRGGAEVIVELEEIAIHEMLAAGVTMPMGWNLNLDRAGPRNPEFHQQKPPGRPTTLSTGMEKPK
jgi:hypothetical protein